MSADHGAPAPDDVLCTVPNTQTCDLLSSLAVLPTLGTNLIPPTSPAFPRQRDIQESVHACRH